MAYLLFLLVGIAVAGVFNDTVSLIVIFGIFILIGINTRKSLSLKKVIIFALLFMIGISYYVCFDKITVERYDDVEIKNVQLTVTVLSAPSYKENYITFTGKVEGYDKNAKITLYDTPYVSCYDKIKLKGNIYSINKDRERYFSNGIYYLITSYDKSAHIIDGTGFLKTVYNVKSKFIYILDNVFSFNTSMFLKGILIGDSNLRTDEFDDSLRKLSLSHIVSVSGMHFSIITMVLLFIMRRMNIGRKASSLITIPISFMLALFIGFTPSIIRVLIMTTVLSLADIFNRERITDIYLLLLTAILMLLFNVYYIHNVAFILSFMSLAGILIYNGKIDEKLNFIPYFIRKYVSVSVSANILTIPFVLYYFKGLSVLSVVANLLIVPLTTVIMIYGIAVSLISFISMKIGYIIGVPLDLITSLCVNVVNFLGNIPFSYFETLSIEAYYICVYFFMLYTLGMTISYVRKLIIILPVFFYFSINLFYPLDTVMLPYANMYVMCGKDSGKSIIEYKDKSVFINASGINDVNYYELYDKFDYHFDIYVAFYDSGIDYLSKKNIYADVVYVPKDFLYNAYFNSILNEHSGKVVPVDREELISFYDFSLTLKPKDGYNILSACLEHNGSKVIFTDSDINSFNNDERYVLNYYMLDKYRENSSVINCLDDEFERIKI